MVLHLANHVLCCRAEPLFNVKAIGIYSLSSCLVAADSNTRHSVQHVRHNKGGVRHAAYSSI